MDKPDLNPLIIFVFYFLRCVLPLGVLLGFSFLLRKLGLIQKSPNPPKDWNDKNSDIVSSNGDFAHG
jgi:hypothetical protein